MKEIFEIRFDSSTFRINFHTSDSSSCLVTDQTSFFSRIINFNIEKLAKLYEILWMNFVSFEVNFDKTEQMKEYSNLKQLILTLIRI